MTQEAKNIAVPYDSLTSVVEQLRIPVVAGAPPPLQSSAISEQDRREKEKEEAYINRLELDRVRLRGSFYLELTPEDKQLMDESQKLYKTDRKPLSLVHHSKEPLPWEGLTDEEIESTSMDFQYDDSETSDWALSSKDSDFQYQSHSTPNNVPIGRCAAGNGNGNVCDGREDVNELSNPKLKSYQNGRTRLGEIDKVNDVDNRVITGKQPSESQTGKENNSQEVSRPKLDQIDLLENEAQVDWLNEQDEIDQARKGGLQIAQHQDDVHLHTNEDAFDSNARTSAFATNNWAIPPEEVFQDPFWHVKHGGLNPVHYHPQNSQGSVSRKDKSRVEEEDDRDEDGIIFPDLFSDEPYSKIVRPTVTNDIKSPLGYLAYNRQGDRIMDFSMVGWNEGNTDIPDAKQDVPVLERVQPRPAAGNDSDQGDDTDRIQQAINRVSQTTGGLVQGLDVVPKGALVLEKGIYRISRPLKIRASGILFRGDPAGGSRIVCQWEPTGPRYAIEILGEEDIMMQNTNVPIVADYIPVGSFYLSLDPTFFDDSGLAVGDQVVVTRVGNKRWIEDIGMDHFDTNKKGVRPWRKMQAKMYRTIRSLNSQTGVVQLDAPLPISIRRQYGGGFVTKYKDNKIRALGIQYLDMVFPKNIGRKTEDMLDETGRGSKDYRFSHEIFSNYAFRIDSVCHMYITHVTSAYFHNFISVGTNVHHLTMDSVVHSYPNDMLSGQSAFQLSGQLVLIKNSLSQGSFHFFVDISHVMGPTVFHRSQTINIGKPREPLPLKFAPGEIGPHMKFCTGILVDQVATDGAIKIINRGDMGTGQGYSGANSVIWNSRAREGILTHRSTGFQNFVIGSEVLEAEDRMPWESHGWKEHLGNEVYPGSLYLRQLEDRLERIAKGWVA
ncbi:hypothetical protein BCR41DRAFT_388277 [Lobosporangium transversale]|uniref:Uncharacterized protein n=1 Tax=Lobosporangium transversale TaxID=64571 RepID=A0A1Y2GG36_9FUNG|nr:hypothetical protein BCR41DRAFT_388277 [Lobosporangium transversale]ORZ09772.1 hypothetical protein BCR41DRAFT_388277 [Lobosporangium transversale]|eukprot:XP_021879042.1 hypothetical protein BCR41DRAFT_388277 [Lobosporangium transversale]